MILDAILIMDIGVARELLSVPEGVVSSYYVEADDPARIDEITRRIEEVDATIDARRVSEFQAPYGMVIDRVDSLLLLAVSLAVLVGVIGIINTMLMGTAERFVEFGVLQGQWLVATRRAGAGAGRRHRPGLAGGHPGQRSGARCCRHR